MLERDQNKLFECLCRNMALIAYVEMDAGAQGLIHDTNGFHLLTPDIQLVFRNLAIQLFRFQARFDFKHLKG